MIRCESLRRFFCGWRGWRSWPGWLALALLTGMLPAQAGVIAPRNLYEGEVLIDPQTPTPRDALMRQALGQVLVRITGDRDIAKRKAGIELMKLATRLVQQFDYDRRPAPPVRGASAAALPAEIKVFRARFDAQVLDAQLRERGLPVWGRERPVTQVWLAVQTEGSRWLLTEGAAALEAPSLLQAALGRGVPIVLPATAGSSQMQDVLQGANAGLVAATQAAGHARLLVGRVAQKGAQWSGQWSLLNSSGGVLDKWQGTAASREEALAFGIDQMANAYAATHAVRGGSTAAAGPVRLLVSGIENAADYARVSRYLAGLSLVGSLDVVELAEGQVQYELGLRGDRVNLQQAIGLSAVLKPAGTNVIAAPDAVLTYQLVK